MDTVSPKLRLLSIPAKYIIAIFIETYGSLALATVIASPLLLYSRVAHTNSGRVSFSVLVDRPYFPLQTAVAFVLGYFLKGMVQASRPAYVWVWPVAQVGLAVLLFRPFATQSFGSGVWQTYFDWDCGCSITLLQWKIMSPLYPSLAFSGAAFLHGIKTLTRRASSAPAR